MRNNEFAAFALLTNTNKYNNKQKYITKYLISLKDPLQLEKMLASRRVTEKGLKSNQRSSLKGNLTKHIINLYLSE